MRTICRKPLPGRSLFFLMDFFVSIYNFFYRIWLKIEHEIILYLFNSLEKLGTDSHNNLHHSRKQSRRFLSYFVVDLLLPFSSLF